MPDDSAAPVVTAACFFVCRRAMGEAFTRHSLRPLISRVDITSTRTLQRRGNVKARVGKWSTHSQPSSPAPGGATSNPWRLFFAPLRPRTAGSPGPVYAFGFDAAAISRARRSLSGGGEPADDGRGRGAQAPQAPSVSPDFEAKRAVENGPLRAHFAGLQRLESSITISREKSPS